MDEKEPNARNTENPSKIESEKIPQNTENFDDTVFENLEEKPDCKNCENTESSVELAVEQVESKKLNEKDEKRKNRLKIIGHILFLLISAMVIVVIALLEDRSGDPLSGKEAFSLLVQNAGYTTVFLSSFFIIVFADVIMFVTLTRKVSPTCSIATCVSASFLGRYYDRITPWATGGEPFQIVYFHNRGLKTSDSLAVSTSRHIIRFFAVAPVVIVIMATSRIATNVYVMVAAVISVTAGLIIPTFMLVCSLKPILGKKIADGVIRFLCKIRIIKDCEKAQKKVTESVEQFLSGVKFLSKNKSLIIIVGLCAILEMFVNNSVPFFVIKALGVSEIRYWETLVLCLFVNYSSSFAPTPGGAGIAELSFYAIFASFVDGGLLFWAVLFWRIAIYFIPVAVGFIIQIFSTIRSISKIKKTA